ncbi:hypothetical protein GGR02_000691 [Anoxybacillus voinovskiensis]|uniref:Uncharacterized protein n=1 Tax=Anoxybacteroides voinovskiense TaxID=230470 RepID=A0A840DJF3_9BACL|nr:hypothetical protein [Anoxybacillus voinovskiensis]
MKVLENFLYESYVSLDNELSGLSFKHLLCKGLHKQDAIM